MSDSGSTHPASEPLSQEPLSREAPAFDSTSTPTDSQSEKRVESGGQAAAIGVDPNPTVISQRPPVGPSPLPPQFASPLEMGAALEGQSLGHFDLEKFVGGGGMGAVFRASDQMLDRTVAVKVLSRDHSNPDILRRFKNEAQVAARLDHENIARVYYVGEDKGWNYIVFEFIEGLNIRQMVSQKGPLPLGEAISYTLQVAEALEHAVQRDVVHRDIKPSNVLITHDGHVKLVDMGLARLHQVEAPDRDLTATGVTLGTFDYISPEQARDPRSADVRSDIYSLGCTFYFMLTARPPFPEGTVLQKLLSHTSDERPDPRVHRPDLPEEIIQILDRMLARQPDQRYQRPSEVVGELLLVADRLGLQEASRGTVWITPGRSNYGLLQYVVPVAVPLLAMILVVIALDRFWPAVPPADFALPAPRLDSPAENGEALALPHAPELTASQPGQAAIEPDAEPAPVADAGPSPAPESLTANQAPQPVADPLEAGGAPVEEAIDSDTPSETPTSDSLSLAPQPLDAQLSVASPLEGSAAVSAEQSGALTVPTEPSDAGPWEGEVPSEPIRRLIVGQASDAADDALLVNSLSAAFEQAAELPEVRTIELRFDGPRVVDPVALTPLELEVRAGDGFVPELVFQPAERDFAAAGSMIRVLGGRVAWEAIHFWFEVPDLSDGWSLFDLDQIGSLEFRDCSFTIINREAVGQTLYQRVAFFQVRPPPRLELMGGLDDSSVDAPVITLNRCIARGQATLVRAEQATPFRVKWQQGLLVTPQRLLDLGGAILEPEWYSSVDIELENVTAVMRRGMALLNAHEYAPYHLYLQVDCSNCILMVDDEVPLVEHSGVRTEEVDADELMEVRVRFCFLPERSIVWRIVPLNGENEIVEYGMGEVKDDWFNQKRPKRITANMWRQLPGGKAAHLCTPSDFLLNELLNENPAIGQMEVAGFEIQTAPATPPRNELPALPREGQTPAAVLGLRVEG